MNRSLIQKFNKIYLNSIELNKIMHKQYKDANEEDFKHVSAMIEEITTLTEDIYNELRSRDNVVEDLLNQAKNAE